MPDAASPGRSHRWNAELADLIDVARRCGLTRVVAMLHAARDRAVRPTCRVVLVGEFSAGKSSLANTLLGRRLLPVGPVPTTTEVTVVQPDGAPPPAFPARSVPSGSPWLSREHIELVDTPGLGDPQAATADREATVSAAARAGDLILLVTPGVGGFTLTDQRLLGRLSASGRNRPPLVVITMLDGADDEMVLRRAELLARRANPAIEVLPAPGLHPHGDVDIRRRRRLKDRITEIARDHHTDGYRSRALGESLAVVCRELRAIAEDGLLAAALDAERRADVRTRLAAERAASQALWIGLRMDLDARAGKLSSLIAERTRECCSDLVRSQLHRLRDSAAPGDLWTEEMSATVASALDQHERTMERLTADELLAAARDADERLAAQNSRRDPLDELAEDAAVGPALDIPRPPAPDRMRSATTVEITAELIAETGEALATLGLEALLPKSPAAEFTGLIGGLISVPLRRRLMDRQRAALTAAVRDGLEAWRDAYTEAAGSRVNHLFARLAAAGRNRQDEWWQARERVWAETAARPLWEGLLFEAERIEKSVTERLRNNV
ncbi:hypothetical protein Aph02nite_85000 [Actinoplanes philippinensis]|uniref:Dynamin family protein n=1 Tax=Actinoplanes philippinensis TaxID=35752 RepID=A0A1I2EPE9_9ACTN|nr:dynamin family protein [Actinoplanes philippinensis]GIE82550.1 hypothetical protein Aph02nite_85000 [Actinoplanes philippinensis]SFE94211.1 Dynamin family protein [Actinoplanes philippinensis]